MAKTGTESSPLAMNGNTPNATSAPLESVESAGSNLQPMTETLNTLELDSTCEYCHKSGFTCEFHKVEAMLGGTPATLIQRLKADMRADAMERKSCYKACDIWDRHNRLNRLRRRYLVRTRSPSSDRDISITSNDIKQYVLGELRDGTLSYEWVFEKLALSITLHRRRVFPKECTGITSFQGILGTYAAISGRFQAIKMRKEFMQDVQEVSEKLKSLGDRQRKLEARNQSLLTESQRLRHKAEKTLRKFDLKVSDGPTGVVAAPARARSTRQARVKTMDNNCNKKSGPSTATNNGGKKPHATTHAKEKSFTSVTVHEQEVTSEEEENEDGWADQMTIYSSIGLASSSADQLRRNGVLTEGARRLQVLLAQPLNLSRPLEEQSTSEKHDWKDLMLILPDLIKVFRHTLEQERKECRNEAAKRFPDVRITIPRVQTITLSFDALSAMFHAGAMTLEHHTGDDIRKAIGCIIEASKVCRSDGVTRMMPEELWLAYMVLAHAYFGISV